MHSFACFWPKTFENGVVFCADGVTMRTDLSLMLQSVAPRRDSYGKLSPEAEKDPSFHQYLFDMGWTLENAQVNEQQHIHAMMSDVIEPLEKFRYEEVEKCQQIKWPADCSRNIPQV